MKTITENVKNAFKRPTTQRKGVILVNGTYYDIYNVEYYADCYDEGKVIGNAIASQLDFDIPYMEKFDTFQYFDCIWVGNSYEHIDYGTFTVFDEQDQDEFNKHITAFDNLIKFNAPFEDIGGYPRSLYDELVNVCNQAGVTLGTNSIPNGDFSVVNNQFTNGESLKTVLKQICAISGTYAIVKNNNLYLQLKNITNETIDKSQHEPVDWKRRSYGINQVIIGDSQIEGEYVIREDPQDIELNGVHKLEIKDNLFAFTQEKRNALVDALFNQVRGFGYIPYETKGEWLSYLEIGDTINIDGIDTILLRVNAKSPESLETTISAPAIIDSSIEYVDNTADVNNRLKLTERTVDKQNQVITDVVSTVDTQNNKISQITQTVDEINAKISDIADITTSAEDTDAQIELTDINESEPIQIKVRPIGESISYLYPNSNLFPSATTYLKVRTIMFTRTYEEDGVTKTQNIPYVLPGDLLYYDSEHYDEFYLDYDSQTCQITKRCKWNADGTVGILATEQVVPYEYPRIILGSGDYTISLLGYSTGYLFARLMAQNIYTTQFYTKSEVDSHIDQKASEIELGVNQTLTNYSTTSQMNSAINLKANEITSQVSETYATKTTTNQLSTRIGQTAKSIGLTVRDNSTSAGITIKLYNEDGTEIDSEDGNITLSGKVSFTDLSTSNPTKTIINGNNITTGTIKSSNYVSGTSGTSINLSNGAIDSKNFKVSSSGNITSTGGTIGGWEIQSYGLKKAFGTNSRYTFEIRTDRPTDQPTLLVYDGTNNRYNFFITPDGYMYARNCEIEGKINATSGSFTGSLYSGSGIIGGWSIENSRLRGLSGEYGIYGAIRPYGVQLEDESGNIITSAGWGSIINASVSDKRLKNNINEIDEKFEQFFDSLKPITFYFNRGIDNGKKHIGFIAQDIIDSEKEIDEELSLVNEDNLSKKYNLNKQELIALNTWQIQKLKKQIKELTKKLEEKYE